MRSSSRGRLIRIRPRRSRSTGSSSVRRAHVVQPLAIGVKSLLDVGSRLDVDRGDRRSVRHLPGERLIDPDGAPAPRTDRKLHPVDLRLIYHERKGNSPHRGSGDTRKWIRVGQRKGPELSMKSLGKSATVCSWLNRPLGTGVETMKEPDTPLPRRGSMSFARAFSMTRSSSI
jgi:hypothetical protein